MLLIIISGILLVIWIVWQFSTIIKYNQYDRFEINYSEKYITINGTRYNFGNISYITVNELKQPSYPEQYLTRGGFYASPCEIIYHMNNGLTVNCRVPAKPVVYDILKKLKSHIKIDEDILKYKRNGLPTWFVVVLLLLGSLLIFYPWLGRL